MIALFAPYLDGTGAGADLAVFVGEVVGKIMEQPMPARLARQH